MLLAVVIPVYNEKALLPGAIRRLDATEPPVLPPRMPDAFGADLPNPNPARVQRRLFIIDDGSTDGTYDLVRSLGERADCHVILHPRNMGKGAAIRSGFKAALDAGADIILVHDADMEYDPADHEAMVRPILDGRADAVIGSRFLGQTHRVLYYWHSLANRFLTMLSNIATNLNLTDIECCLKAFSRDALSGMRLTEDRFGIEPEMIARLARVKIEERDRTDPNTPVRWRRARIFEVPVSYSGRTYAEGKKITWRDGIAAILHIFWHNLRR